MLIHLHRWSKGRYWNRNGESVSALAETGNINCLVRPCFHLFWETTGTLSSKEPFLFYRLHLARARARATSFGSSRMLRTLFSHLNKEVNKDCPGFSASLPARKVKERLPTDECARSKRLEFNPTPVSRLVRIPFNTRYSTSHTHVLEKGSQIVANGSLPRGI